MPRLPPFDWHSNEDPGNRSTPWHRSTFAPRIPHNIWHVAKYGQKTAPKSTEKVCKQANDSLSQTICTEVLRHPMATDEMVNGIG